jgi:hypothetical protein
MDITNVPMAWGFVYLAVVLDWFSRRVFSFCIAAGHPFLHQASFRGSQ